MWFLNRSDTSRAVQAQKMAKGCKFWNWKVEELYYTCSENKGDDQFRSYCEADLRLCFRICKMLVYYDVAHIRVGFKLFLSLVMSLNKTHLLPLASTDNDTHEAFAL